MIAVLLLLLLTSCSMSELVAVPETRSDTTEYTPRHRDTTEVSGVPIGFEVVVEEWEND